MTVCRATTVCHATTVCVLLGPFWHRARQKQETDLDTMTVYGCLKIGPSTSATFVASRAGLLSLVVVCA